MPCQQCQPSAFINTVSQRHHKTHRNPLSLRQSATPDPPRLAAGEEKSQNKKQNHTMGRGRALDLRGGGCGSAGATILFLFLSKVQLFEPTLKHVPITTTYTRMTLGGSMREKQKEKNWDFNKADETQFHVWGCDPRFPWSRWVIEDLGWISFLRTFVFAFSWRWGSLLPSFFSSPKPSSKKIKGEKEKKKKGKKKETTHRPLSYL
ncbi:hypothetical protein B0J13DRAFT_104632 [Dactylonectria estremocensis]|uniref:Uncharacterized protein n=1 Tax=Dactylonectria estremocensis TaxID=1079267 RepID=A0A9P9E4S8_9HYPO|nr:hypothetical protein B0J13DRAFT_104632 [Dactylonectria estremocensis]